MDSRTLQLTNMEVDGTPRWFNGLPGARWPRPPVHRSLSSSVLSTKSGRLTCNLEKTLPGERQPPSTT